LTNALFGSKMVLRLRVLMNALKERVNEFNVFGSSKITVITSA
jgi:hypothetical protein